MDEGSIRADRHVHRPGPRRSLAAATGLLLFAVTYAALASGVLPGPLAALLPLVLILLVPVAPSLARRAAVNGTIFLGWAPVLWWVQWPMAVNHGAFVTALAVALLAVYVVGSPNPRAQWRRLAPTVSRTDLLLPAAAAFALTMMHRWAFEASPQRTLAFMIPGYDNVAHFDMFAMLRRHGATIDALGAAPGGSSWAFGDYPQSFHALVATYAELALPEVTPGTSELTLFANGVAAVVVLGTVVLTAAVCSLPGLRSRPLIAFPVVVTICTAFLWEPGAKVLADGFGNFWLGCVAASVALLLSLTRRDELSIPELAAVGGALVVVAHTWAPLLVVAAPAALALLAVRRPVIASPASPLRLVALLGVAAASIAAVLKAVVTVLSTVELGFVVQAEGPLTGASAIPTFVLIIVSVYVCLSFAGWVDRLGVDGPAPAVARRVKVLALAPVCGVVSLTLLLVAQFRSVGTTSYYFLKYLMGFELILAAVTAAVVGMLLALVARPRWGRSRSLLVSTTAAVLATQAFGHVAWNSSPLTTDFQGARDAGGTALSLPAMAQGIVTAAAATSGGPPEDREYVALGRARGFEAILPATWYHAIQGSLTLEAQQRQSDLVVLVSDETDAAPLVLELMEQDPTLEIVVAPRYAEPLRQQMPSPELAARITTFEVP